MFFPEVAVELPGIVDLEPSTEFVVPAGYSIGAACEALCRRASIEGRPWTMVFNGTRVEAQAGDIPSLVFARWLGSRSK